MVTQQNALQATAIATGAIVLKTFYTAMRQEEGTLFGNSAANDPLKVPAAAYDCVLTRGQGGSKFKAGVRPPEDSGFAPDKNAQGFEGTSLVPPTDQEKKALEEVRRQDRIVGNDLENVPLGLIVAWGALQSPASATAHVVLVSLFAACRVFHTFAYEKALQPHRALAWGTGVLSVWGLIINGIIGSFRK